MARPGTAGTQVGLLLLHGDRMISARAAVIIIRIVPQSIGAMGMAEEVVMRGHHSPPGKRMVVRVADCALDR